MKKLLLLISLFTSICFAENYEFTHRQIIKTKVKNTAPQVIIFNDKQELIFQADEYVPNILSKLRIKDPLANSEQMKKNLKSLIKKDLDFNDQGVTVYFVTISPDIGLCPPCRQQEKVMDKLLEKLPNSAVNMNSITLINETYTIDVSEK